MGSADWWIAVFGTGGITAAVTAIAKAIFKYLTGRADADRISQTKQADALDDALKKLDDLRDELDREIRRNSQLVEYVGTLRGQLRENGITPMERD